MDKLGIFKLLNGLFSLYQQNSAGSSAKDSSPIFNSIDKEATIPIPPKSTTPKPIKPKPLQSGMLFTMSNHDALVKRVMQNKNNKI